MAKTTKKSPTPTWVKPFLERNQHCEFHNDVAHGTVRLPWNDGSLEIRIPRSRWSEFRWLRDIVLPPHLYAIWHADRGLLEVIAPFFRATRESQLVDRAFSICVGTIQARCWFAEPTDRLLALATVATSSPTESELTAAVSRVHAGGRLRLLKPLRDYQRVDELPDYVGEWFSERVPRSFFVQPNSEILLNPNCEFFGNLNFAMSYYDRNSPSVIVLEDSADELPDNAPLQFIDSSFPLTIALQPIDPFLLRLFEVAATSEPRFAFIYYYQVIEYSGYYYMDADVRKRLRLFVSNPAVTSCTDDTLSELFEIASTLQQNDDSRMRRVISERCDPSVLWREVAHRRAALSEPVVFDGGFALQAFIAKSVDLSGWQSMWMPKTYDTLTQIRNAIVHARERRQSEVIQPTDRNEALLELYLPILRRLAEQVAIRS